MEEVIGEETLIYDIGQPKDVAEVSEFASEYFFNSSPIRELATFDDPTDEVGKFAWRQGRLQSCFSRPTSIIVREKSSGNVVAFHTKILEDRKDNIKSLTNDEGGKENLKDRSAGWLSRAIATQLSKNFDLFDRYGTDRILFFWFGAVRRDYCTGKEKYSPLTEYPIGF